MRIIDSSFFKGGSVAAIMLIIALTFAVYANSLGNLFAGDDSSIIVGNDFIKSWKNFPAIFSRDYLNLTSGGGYAGEGSLGSGERTYRPVVTATYFIDYSLWRTDPFGYHLGNLILHIFNSILLYFFIAFVARDKKVALLTSLFFGLHPVNSEAVNAIAFREDLLAFLFFTASFILFVKSDYYARKGRFYCCLASALLFLLALFSKEMAITLPLLLILYDYYFVFGKNPKKILSSLKSRYLGYIAVLLFYLWVRLLLVVNRAEFLIEYPGNSFYTNLFTMPRVFATYIIWLFVPVGIHVTLRDASFFGYSFFEPEVLVSILLVITCFILSIAVYKKSKLISFAMLWFFISLLPVSNILPISNMMASRYLYIPAVGFCLLIAILLHRLPTLKSSLIPEALLPRVARDIIIILVVFYSTFTIIRSLTWRNDITLWSEAVEYYPYNAFAHCGLGDCFKEKKWLDRAISEYKTAVSLDPHQAATYHLLGVCYGEKKQYQKAIVYLKQAIRLQPGYAEAYDNLGVTYGNMKNYTEARKSWEKALEIDPEYKKAKDNLKKLRQIGIDQKSINYVQNSTDKK